VACLLAANRGSNCSLTRAMDGRLLRCGIISSCRSAATSEIVKHFRATLRSAIASVGLQLSPLPLITSPCAVSVTATGYAFANSGSFPSVSSNQQKWVIVRSWIHNGVILITSVRSNYLFSLYSAFDRNQQHVVSKPQLNFYETRLYQHHSRSIDWRTDGRTHNGCNSSHARSNSC